MRHGIPDLLSGPATADPHPFSGPDPARSSRRHRSESFSEERYRALMQTPFWAISILLHALLYVALYHSLLMDRPLPGNSTAIDVAMAHQPAELLALDDLRPPVQEHEIDVDPIDAPELDTDVEDDPSDEVESSRLEGDRARPAFDHASQREPTSDLSDLGFTEDMWSTEFGEHVETLRDDGLDVVFLFDSTSSMNPVLNQAKNNIASMITVLHTLVPTFRLGIATYRDYNENYVVKSEPLSLGRYRLMTYLDTIQGAGGGNLEEAVFSALEHCSDAFDWSPTAQRVIILIGDAAPHEDEVEDAGQVAYDFRKDGGIVHTVVTFDPSSTMGEFERRTARQFERIAQRGGGRFVTLGESEDLVVELLALSFGNSWRDEISTAYANVRSKSSWRDQFLARMVRAGNLRSLARKLRVAPVYPGVVEHLIAHPDRRVEALVLSVMQDQELPDDCHWAGAYVMLKRSGLRLRRLPDSPLPLLRSLEERYRENLSRTPSGR